MSLSQELWSLDDKLPLNKATLKTEKELEDLLDQNINLLNSNWLVIGRQIRTTLGKYIDLLCMDHNGDLIVVELKKGLTPREVTAQTIDYASSVSRLSLEDIAKIYLDRTNQNETLNEAYEKKYHRPLEENSVNQNVKMVVVASQMDQSTEQIIHYLRDTYQVDINILFFNIFQCGDKRLISRVWFEDDIEQNTDLNKVKGSWNGEYYVSFGSGKRHWEDARNLGFISAGGGVWYSQTLSLLTIGDRVWVNIPHTGYVGVGRVIDTVKQAKDILFEVNSIEVGLSSIKTKANYLYETDDQGNAEYIVKIQWEKTVSEDKAISELGFFGNQNSVCRPKSEKWEHTVNRLKKIWEIE